MAGGLVVTGLIVAGVYAAFGRKTSPTTSSNGYQPIAEATRTDAKPKPTEPVPPKIDTPAPVTVLPKDFADQLKPKTFSGHAGAVNGLAVAASGARFVSVGTDRTLRLWTVASDESMTRHTFVSPAVGVAWYGKDRAIAVADGLSLALFDAEKAAAPRIFDSPRGGVACMAIGANGVRALTGLRDGFVRLWDTGAGRADEWAVAASGPITAIDISPDGTQALIAVADGPVSLWSLAGRNRVHEWKPHAGGAIALQFSPDGKHAATAGPDGAAAIYNLAMKKDVCRLDGHVGPVTGIAWLPDGRHVVTVGVDGTARLWSAESGQALRWSQTLNGKGNCVAVDPGGRFVLAGTSTGAIRLFPLPRVRAEIVAGPLGKPPALPLPLPDPEAVAAAIAGVRTELARDFAYNRPDDMALLADNLRRRAAMERVTPTLRFGLLQEARALAARAGDPATAFQAIEDLATWFDIDEFAEKATTFAAMPARCRCRDHAESRRRRRGAGGTRRPARNRRSLVGAYARERSRAALDGIAATCLRSRRRDEIRSPGAGDSQECTGRSSVESRARVIPLLSASGLGCRAAAAGQGDRSAFDRGRQGRSHDADRSEAAASTRRDVVRPRRRHQGSSRETGNVGPGPRLVRA